MRTVLLLSIIVILASCKTDEDNSLVETGENSTVLTILQSMTAWELEYDNEVFEPPYNYEVYNEYHKFNGGDNPDGLRESYFLRYNEGDVPRDCYFVSIMNAGMYEEYYILSNDDQKLVIYNPSDIIEPNKLVYTLENGKIRYQYQEEGFEGDYFPAATLTPSTIALDNLNVCD